MARKHRLSGRLDGFPRNALAAADADVQQPRHKPQRLRKRRFRVDADQNAKCPRVALDNAIRQRPPDGKLAHERHVMFQNLRRDLFRKRHARDGTAVFRRPGVDSESAVHVRRRRDDRRCAEHARQSARQIVRAADVTGEQRDHKLHLLVDADHRGIGLLAHKIRRDLAHGDAARADENERIHR